MRAKNIADGAQKTHDCQCSCVYQVECITAQYVITIPS